MMGALRKGSPSTKYESPLTRFLRFSCDQNLLADVGMSVAIGLFLYAASPMSFCSLNVESRVSNKQATRTSPALLQTATVPRPPATMFSLPVVTTVLAVAALASASSAGTPTHRRLNPAPADMAHTTLRGYIHARSAPATNARRFSLGLPPLAPRHHRSTPGALSRFLPVC
jgi:hypothetical protein